MRGVWCVAGRLGSQEPRRVVTLGVLGRESLGVFTRRAMAWGVLGRESLGVLSPWCVQACSGVCEACLGVCRRVRDSVRGACLGVACVGFVSSCSDCSLGSSVEEAVPSSVLDVGGADSNGTERNAVWLVLILVPLGRGLLHDSCPRAWPEIAAGTILARGLGRGSLQARFLLEGLAGDRCGHDSCSRAWPEIAAGTILARGLGRRSLQARRRSSRLQPAMGIPRDF